MGSDTDLDLVRLDEDTLRELLFLADITLATLALSPRRNLTGAESGFGSLSSRKAQIPVALFLVPPTLVPLPCFRYIIGLLSYTSGLKLTRLLACLDMIVERKKNKWWRKGKQRTWGELEFLSRGGSWIWLWGVLYIFVNCDGIDIEEKREKEKDKEMNRISFWLKRKWYIVVCLLKHMLVWLQDQASVWFKQWPNSYECMGHAHGVCDVRFYLAHILCRPSELIQVY